jgi:hypothetical protein
MDFARWATVAGGLLWVLGVGWLVPGLFDAAWAQALLVLAPMVLVPLALDRTGPWAAGGAALSAVSVAAGLCLGLAFLGPPGASAAALALPWLAVSGCLAVGGVMRLGRARRNLVEEVAFAAGMIYLAVGAGWAVLNRAGARPLDFEPVIVLLTAIHFHYAGFVLPVLTGQAAGRVKGRWAAWAVGGIAASVPLVAAGITATQLGFGPWLECAGACLMALGGTLTGGLYVRLAAQSGWPTAARILWASAALALFIGMALAALYGLRFGVPLDGLDIPWMRAVHGTLNALGFALPGLLGWLRAGRGDTAYSLPSLPARAKPSSGKRWFP